VISTSSSAESSPAVGVILLNIHLHHLHRQPVAKQHHTLMHLVGYRSLQNPKPIFRHPNGVVLTMPDYMQRFFKTCSCLFPSDVLCGQHPDGTCMGRCSDRHSQSGYNRVLRAGATSGASEGRRRVAERSRPKGCKAQRMWDI
jgi:hypothetical protein